MERAWIAKEGGTRVGFISMYHKLLIISPQVIQLHKEF